MAVRYYDDALSAKIKSWIPDNRPLRVLKPDETARLFETAADDSGDKPLQLPLIALSRDTEIELLQNIKSPKSFAGLILEQTEDRTLQFNVIPISVNYQLDIYTKTFVEGDEYLRNFLFKLINNPKIIIGIPYNNKYVEHVANIRVNSSVADTSSISERIFPGQFTRWTLRLEIQDAFLFSLPYRNNWKMLIDGEYVEMPGEKFEENILEFSNDVNSEGYEWENLGYMPLKDCSNKNS